MSTIATAPYAVPQSNEAAAPQLSEQDLEKLQAIHELINLMIRELPVMAQVTARPYVAPMLPVVPYTYSFFQPPWGRMPFLTPQTI